MGEAAAVSRADRERNVGGEAALGVKPEQSLLPPGVDHPDQIDHLPGDLAWRRLVQGKPICQCGADDAGRSTQAEGKTWYRYHIWDRDGRTPVPPLHSIF